MSVVLTRQITRSHSNEIVEEIGLDDGVTALTQLGLIKAA